MEGLREYNYRNYRALLGDKGINGNIFDEDGGYLEKNPLELKPWYGMLYETPYKNR